MSHLWIWLSITLEDFWKEEDIAVVDELAEDAEENPLFEENPDHFINDYAATNPGEDIAESFVYFVLTGRDNIARTVADEKLSFFYQFEELVQMRSDIRATFAKKRKAVQVIQ